MSRPGARPQPLLLGCLLASVDVSPHVETEVNDAPVPSVLPPRSRSRTALPSPPLPLPDLGSVAERPGLPLVNAASLERALLSEALA